MVSLKAPSALLALARRWPASQSPVSVRRSGAWMEPVYLNCWTKSTRKPQENEMLLLSPGGWGGRHGLRLRFHPRQAIVHFEASSLRASGRWSQWSQSQGHPAAQEDEGRIVGVVLGARKQPDVIAASTYAAAVEGRVVLRLGRQGGC
jgi:hypothetical protein